MDESPNNGAGLSLCQRCAADCCRLTVVLIDTDVVAPELVELDANGVRSLARRADGWCKALGDDHRCTIYADRPQTCRNFVMAGAYCRALRADHAELRRRGLPMPDYRSRGQTNPAA